MPTCRRTRSIRLLLQQYYDSHGGGSTGSPNVMAEQTSATFLLLFQIALFKMRPRLWPPAFLPASDLGSLGFHLGCYLNCPDRKTKRVCSRTHQSICVAVLVSRIAYGKTAWSTRLSSRSGNNSTETAAARQLFVKILEEIRPAIALSHLFASDKGAQILNDTSSASDPNLPH